MKCQTTIINKYDTKLGSGPCYSVLSLPYGVIFQPIRRKSRTKNLNGVFSPASRR